MNFKDWASYQSIKKELKQINKLPEDKDDIHTSSIVNKVLADHHMLLHAFSSNLDKVEHSNDIYIFSLYNLLEYFLMY